jgi:hypothetical protein
MDYGGFTYIYNYSRWLAFSQDPPFAYYSRVFHRIDDLRHFELLGQFGGYFSEQFRGQF